MDCQLKLDLAVARAEYNLQQTQAAEYKKFTTKTENVEQTAKDLALCHKHNTNTPGWCARQQTLYDDAKSKLVTFNANRSETFKKAQFDLNRAKTAQENGCE